MPLFEFEDGTPLARCPLRSIDQAIGRVATAWRLKVAGILPVAGGWLDQSASLIAAFEVLETEMGSYADRK